MTSKTYGLGVKETKKTGMTSDTYGFKHRPSRKGRDGKENS